MKWIEIISNVLFWTISGSLIVSSFSIQGHEIEIIDGVETIQTIRDDNLIYQLLTCLSVAFILFYANLINVNQLGKGVPKNKTLFVSLSLLLLSSIVLVFIQQNILTYTYGLPSQISISILLFFFTISSSYGLLKVWIIMEQKQKNLALIAKQAELNLLRNQLQPHFLFNALNNLLAFVDQQKNPKMASSIEELSQLLRYVIEETKSEKVLLSKEIDFIRNYCHLQLLRFEDQEVDFKLKVNGEIDRLEVEPGLFIPFVENAFKYGTKPETNSFIEVLFSTINENEIIFSVKNTLFENSQEMGTGTGITTVRDRLKIVYPNKHELNITTDNSSYLVKLKLM